MLSPIGIFWLADLEILDQRLDQAVGQLQRGFWLLARSQHEGELVAADAGEESTLRGNPETAGNGAQQFVADGVAEDVVGFLEMIEVDGPAP